MDHSATMHTDPADVLQVAGALLERDPVRHNLILTLLQARAGSGEPGRYWTVTDTAGACVGVVLQSPLDFPATTTPMTPAAVAAAVDAIARAGVTLPGVNGEAATAAAFAGRWTERRGAAARPTRGQRLYESEGVVAPAGVSGRARPAAAEDRGVLVEFLRGFSADAGERSGDVEAVVDRRLALGQFRVWDDDGPVSMAATSAPVAGTVRVQAVYTPPERRRQGYAGACVAAVAREVAEAGRRCILYTDLGNATSNSVYRRIGFRAVAEGLRYEFS